MCWSRANPLLNHWVQGTLDYVFCEPQSQRPSAPDPGRYANTRAKGKPTASRRLAGLATAYCLIVVQLPMGKSPAQDFTYTNTNGTITITGYIGPGGNVAIPANIGGLPVTAIGGVTFMGNTNLTAITIPDTVTNIEDG